MFTGLVETRAPVLSCTDLVHGNGSASRRLIIALPAPWQVQLGESIAVNGVCLTLAALEPSGAGVFDVSAETLAKTTLGTIAANDNVNLERALALGDRLGGHLVLGHVDTTSVVASIEKKAQDELYIEIIIPPAYQDLVIPKGSIAVDGISLTINELKDFADHSRVSLWIIPTTARGTTIANWRPGTKINIEFDMLGKYILRSQRRTPIPST